jgi:adenine-specific DNA-methyltransferase
MYTTKNDATMISDCHEYVMVYAKDSETRPIGLLPRSAEANDRYSNPDNDPRGDWKPIPLYAKEERKNGRYPIKSPKTGKVFGLPPNKHWLYRQEDTEALISDNRIWFGKDGNSLPNVKRFLTEVQQGLKPKTLWNYEDVGTNDSAKKELKLLYGETIPFDFPKPTTLIKRMLQLCTSNNDIVLDCFAGSGTTAQAVLDLNREDGGNRKFILVQLPEAVKENSDASKLGFKWVHEVTRDRVRKFIGSQKMKAGFSYSTLGSSIDSRKILEGKELPSWENFAKYAHYLATGKSIDDAAKDEKTWEIKSGTKKTGVFLIYKDGLEDLKNLAITREWLEKVKSDGRRKIVYAPACFLDKEVLDEHNIQFVQIPFNLFIRG